VPHKKINRAPTAAHGTMIWSLTGFCIEFACSFLYPFFMSQSLANILVHLVFSTRDRTPWINDEWRDDLHAYIGGVIRRHGSNLLAAGSVEDHIHLLFPMPRTVSVSELVKEIKSGSSRWIHDAPTRPRDFYWQSGYGVFSLSPGHKEAALQYIASQREHHRTTSFQDEYRKLLVKYEIGYDEKYVWD
jgi:REP element-mobilizing transposase RayT